MHGGPYSQWRDAWVLRWNYHLLAGSDTVLLLTNYKGSTGFGEAEGPLPTAARAHASAGGDAGGALWLPYCYCVCYPTWLLFWLYTLEAQALILGQFGGWSVA